MTSMTPLPGDPDTLGNDANRYSTVAQAIADTARQLRTFAEEVASDGGKAVAELAGRASGAGAKADQAHPRYATTASALATYAVQLKEAQDSATAAISAADSVSSTLDYYEDRKVQLTPHPREVLTDAERQERATDLAHVNARLESIRQDMADAQAQYNRAVEYRDLAATTAINSITPVLAAMNDSVGDYVNAWVNSLPDFLQAIGRWLGDIFVSIVESLQDLIAEFVAEVTYIWTAIVMIPEIMANLPAEFWVAALISPGLVLPLIWTISSLIAARIAKEPLRPTPTMTQVGESTESSSPPNHYSDTMTTNVRLDDDGGPNATDVEIVEVLDENGERVGWRVILPSTQDWQEADGFFGGDGPKGDRGGVNDLDSNLALMLTPSQQAAYQRAVAEAMQAAGIGPNDPVMLCGWSQGGILAGRMASDPNSPFNIQAIYVSGAPIDAMPIPDSVSVISVQHTGEPVAILDGPLLAPGHEGANWTTITVDQQVDPATGKPPIVDGSERSPHNGTAYAETAARTVDDPINDKVARIAGEQDMFFSDNEVVRIYEGAEEPVPYDPLLEAAA